MGGEHGGEIDEKTTETIFHLKKRIDIAGDRFPGN